MGGVSTVGAFVALLVIGTTIWVAIDAHQLGVQRGKLGGGSLDMSATSWTVCCLLLWIVAFPCYLVARGKYRVLQTPAPAWPAPPQAGYPQPGYPQPGYGLPAPVMVTQAQPVPTPPVAPPQLSPDRQWWWDGTQWLPAPSTTPLTAPPTA
jgi:hypothetical protein